MDETKVDRSHLGKGEYANYFEVGHDFVAFYLDCGQVGADNKTMRVYNRIITSPVCAKRLVKVLENALDEYFLRFGQIRDEGGEIILGTIADE